MGKRTGNLFWFLSFMFSMFYVAACGSVATRAVTRTPNVEATVQQAAHGTYEAYQIEQSIAAEVTRLIGANQTETATQWTLTIAVTPTAAAPTRTATLTLAPLNTAERTATPTLVPLGDATATRTASPTLAPLGSTTPTRIASPTLAPLGTEVSGLNTPVGNGAFTATPLAEPVHIPPSGSQIEWG